jgi:hypothetical protein
VDSYGDRRNTWILLSKVRPLSLGLQRVHPQIAAGYDFGLPGGVLKQGASFIVGLVEGALLDVVARGLAYENFFLQLPVCVGV